MNPLKSLLDWLTADEGRSWPAVDTEYVLRECDRYTHMAAGEAGGGWCRCNLCGKNYQLEEFPELVDHVAAHGEQGAAEIDPFENSADYLDPIDRSEITTMSDESAVDEAEECSENTDEVEA